MRSAPVLDAAIARLRHERSDTQDENRFLAALIDDVPSPLHQHR